MKNLVRLAKTAFPNWNKQIISQEDLQKYCDSSRIIVLDFPTPNLGEYTVFEQRDCIILDPCLQDRKRHWVFAHECGHVLFHHPYEQTFGTYTEDLFREKLEFKANFFAAVALMPMNVLRIKTFSAICDEYGYAEDLIWLRKEVFDRYRL